MHLMGGMSALDKSYTETNIGEMVQKGVGWLILLFLGQMFTVTAIASYEDTLALAAILALFIPMFISCGGNSGSRAVTLLIRSFFTPYLILIDRSTVLRTALVTVST